MNPRYAFLIAVLFSITSACNNGNKQDSNAVAEKENETKFDTRAEEKEANFVAEAIEEKYEAIKLGELANTKSSSKAIQEFAQKLVSDQSQSLEAFQKLADKKGISVPIEEGQEGRQKVNALAKQQALAFDKKWCEEIVARNEKEIKAFELMRDKSQDSELKGIVTEDLKALRAQLDSLNAIEEHIN